MAGSLLIPKGRCANDTNGTSLQPCSRGSLRGGAGNGSPGRSGEIYLLVATRVYGGVRVSVFFLVAGSLLIPKGRCANDTNGTSLLQPCSRGGLRGGAGNGSPGRSGEIYLLVATRVYGGVRVGVFFSGRFAPYPEGSLCQRHQWHFSSTLFSYFSFA